MALIVCKECGSQVSDGAKFCPRCGAAVQAAKTAGLDLSSVTFRSQEGPAEARVRSAGGKASHPETGFVSGFERKVLFRIARFVAFAISFVLFLAMVGGLIYIGLSFSSASRPDPAQVVQSLRQDSTDDPAKTGGRSPQSGNSPSLGALSPLTGIRLQPELQELMTQENNRRVLEGWLSELEEEDRQSFVDALGNAVREARLAGVDEITAINSYYTQYKSYLAEREMSRLASTQARLYVAGAVSLILLMLALFSLVLVLLAIERNTYRFADRSGAVS